ncbi:hypothetical protein Syun_020324 [Stephania yunnanensis]|uniref:Uncharacterized protein n=1 Tax=Stephania yunnanensis TaxID=152371 RepID=A0AAP0NN24_9MAGN
MDALQLMRNDMIPTEVDVSTSRRDDVSSIGIIIDSESDEDVDVDKLKRGVGKEKNVALDQYLAKSNGIKPKVNIPDGKLKPVGAWAAEFTTELEIICRTYAPIRDAQWKKVEQKDKEQIYNLIRDKFADSRYRISQGYRIINSIPIYYHNP